MNMSCDPVGNLLLAKFAYHGAKDSCLILPSHVVFWLLKHLPVNQNPHLPPPPRVPDIYQDDWHIEVPRVLSVQCTEFPRAIRMICQLDTGADITLMLDPTSVELMRQILQAYQKDLMDLDA